MDNFAEILMKIRKDEPRLDYFTWPVEDQFNPIPYSNLKDSPAYKLIQSDFKIKLVLSKLDYLRFDDYHSNNDRKAHGKHVLRHRQIEKCRKLYPELTIEVRIGKRIRQSLNQEMERNLIASHKKVCSLCNAPMMFHDAKDNCPKLPLKVAPKPPLGELKVY